MEKMEQPTPIQEKSPAEMLKVKANDKIKEDIAEAKKRLEETDLSDDFVLTSKLGVNEIGEYQEKIKGYEGELQEVEAGTINPEYVLYSHSDVDSKLDIITEKVAPDSELATILKSEHELQSLPVEDADFIRKYAVDVARLRYISARHRAVEKEMQERNVGAEDEVWLRQDKINLELDLKKRHGTFFKDMDTQREDDLRAIVSHFGKRIDLRNSILNGHSSFANNYITPYEVENLEKKGKVLSYYGQIDMIFKEFKGIEAEKFPRGLEKNKEEATKPEQMSASAAVVESDGEKTKEKDKEALKRVRESLGIETATPYNSRDSQKSEKLFVSPELVSGYKNDVEQLTGYFGTLDRFLRDRTDEGLADLIDDNEVGRMASVVRRLGDMDIKEQNDFEEISVSFAKLHDSVESIGTLRSRNVKDSVDNLKSVAYVLMMVGESTQDVARRLKTMETPEALQAAKQADRLADAVFDRRMAMLRRMEQIGDYLGR